MPPRNLVVVTGAVLFFAGLALFFVFGRSANSLYDWSWGPLLWTLGGVSIVGGAMNRALTASSHLAIVSKREREKFRRAA